MIGKSIKGKSFGGCVRYVVQKKDAAILIAQGISAQSSAAIIRDFDFQRKLNPALSKAVGHTVLSWSEQDKPQLTDGKMVRIAQQYMQEMGITDTQYLMVKHSDRGHPHIHIIFNRVNNQGKTITDKNDFARNAKVCRCLTEAYGLHIATGKDKVKRHQLKGSDKVRYAVYDALSKALKTAVTWQQLQTCLKQEGIAIQFKYKRGTGEVQGVSFEKNGMVFKGSAIDRSMSLAGIERQLHSNATSLNPGNTTHEREALKEQSNTFDAAIGLAEGVADMLSGLLPPAKDMPPEEPPLWQQKKKRKKRRRM